MNFRILIGLIYLLSFNLNASSLNCDQKLTKIESLICSDQESSDLDLELSSKYDRYTRNFSDRSFRIEEEQIKWLKEVRNKCNNIECIRDSYKIRLYYLNKHSWAIRHYLSYLGRFYYVKEHYQTDDNTISTLNKLGLQNTESKISSCETLVSIPLGFDRGTPSYGGLCTLNKDEMSQKVLVCGNSSKKLFKLEQIEELPSISQLAIFIVKNCYGD